MKDIFETIIWGVKELFLVSLALVLFFLGLLVFVVVSIGFSTGTIWTYILIGLISIFILSVVAKLLFTYANKKWEKEYQKQLEEKNRVEYVIIK